jgi:predicted nucleic acid-binding protein
MSSNPIFVDTNLFLRYLTNDVPEQADAVEELLIKAGEGELSLITNQLVIAEIVWTLESYYEAPKEDIKEKILVFLNSPGLKIVDAGMIMQAMGWYVEKNIDFNDAYHAAWMDAHNIDTVFTFDRKHFSRLVGINVLTPE